MPSRDRITITIRKDLLRSLDRTIDKQRVRNRSHAIEVALSRILDSEAKQAVILASGAGVKMRPFTYEIPKPLIPVNGQPLLEYGLAILRDHGIKDIVITVSHLADKITDNFGDGKKMGLNITYVHEKKRSGTGGALRACKKHLDPAPFIMLYSDILFNLDLTEFLDLHQQNKSALGTLALTSVADPSAYGAVKLRGSKIVEFSEKPLVDNDVSHLVFAGCAAFNHSIFSRLSKSKSHLSLEKDIFPKLIRQGCLYGYPFEGRWFDVSTPEIYAQVLKKWK